MYGGAAFHDFVHTVLIPGKFAFTYVQTALLWASSPVELAREDKDRYYDLYAWLVGVPITIMGWVEATTCEGFLVKWGGHLW